MSIRGLAALIRSARGPCAWAVLLCLISSCTPTAFLNLTATRRGNITIGLINNTPFRANLTFGGYDPLDQTTIPVFTQIRIEGNTTAPTQTQQCRRVFSLGGAELIRLVTLQRSGTSPINDAAVLHQDIFFSSAPANDPLAAAPTEGTAQQRVLLDGVDYLCGGVLTFAFVQDAGSPGGFRMDYTFVRPADPQLPPP